MELSRHAKQVYLSTRRGSWVFPRMTTGGYPGDQFRNRRFFSLLPKSVITIIGKKVANENFDHEKFGLKPDHDVFQQHPMVNDDLPLRMATGRLKIKPNVKLIKETSKLLRQTLSFSIGGNIAIQTLSFFFTNSIILVLKFC